MGTPSFEDWHAIVGQLNRLAELFDARRWDALGEVIAEDAVCYGQRGIPALIENNLRVYLGGCGPSQHLLGNYAIEVDGEAATSAVKIRAFHVGRGERAQQSFESIGVYRDRWRRTAAGWRMVERVFDVHVNFGEWSVLQPG
jgi:3-phenylpropionate/cinnamic acid dioxygenase small subunit